MAVEGHGSPGAPRLAVEGHGSPGAPRLAMRELEHLQVPVLGGRLAGPSVELALCVVQQGDEANVSRGCCCVGRGACVQRALPFLNEHARDLGAAAPGCHPGDPQVGFQGILGTSCARAWRDFKHPE